MVLTDFALPDDAITPGGKGTAALQREDLAAFVSLCIELLGPTSRALNGKSWEAMRADNATMRDLAEALEEDVRYNAVRLTTAGFAPALLDTRKEVDLPPRIPSVGDILGKCLLTRKIGEGATGVVFQATHQTLDVEVAVKILSSASGVSEDLSQSFRSEARLLARLNHAHIVRIWDFEVRSEFPPYLVLELIDGQNLAELVHQRGRLSTAEAIPIFRQVITGFIAAQQQTGLVHRDVKPANILLTADGTAKVADFGLAFALEAGKTHSNGCVGTPAYVAPEQALGDRPVDFRADIYALGVTMYQAVTGSLPFTGRSPMEVINKHLTEMPLPPHERVSTVPLSLSAIIMQMMAKKPDDRFKSYQELLRALGDVTDTSPVPGIGPAMTTGKKSSSFIRRLFGL